MHGRQVTHPKLSYDVLSQFAGLVDGCASMTEPILSGKLLYAVLTRKKK